MKENLVIGLTGRFGAGCTTTADFFKNENGFTHFSLSDYLKDKARSRYRDFDKKTYDIRRKILQDFGDDLRSKNPTSLLLPVIQSIKKNNIKKVVIETLRNPAEVDVLRSEFRGFFLIAIDAEIETRWRRLKHIYKGNRDKFNINDERDAGTKQPKYGQQVKKCIELADILINSEEDFYKNIKKRIKNNKVIDAYGQRIGDYLRLIQEPGIRKPSEDELYMHYSYSISLRSNCLKRQVGAVIVKDGYVVATGCNNVPRGEDNCEREFRLQKEKCYRSNQKSKYLNSFIFCKACGNKLLTGLICEKCKHDNEQMPGKLLDLCRSVHAEEAAILQTAKLGGISLEGTKLYTSTFPCMLCCKKIIDSGITNIIYLESYPMGESLAVKMFKNCGIKISKFEGVHSRSFLRFFKRQIDV